MSLVDNNTAALILQLQLEELQHLTARRKGKSRTSESSDADLALQLYKENLDRWNAVLTNHSRAGGVGTAVVADGARPAHRAQEMTRQMDASVENDRDNIVHNMRVPPVGSAEGESPPEQVECAVCCEDILRTDTTKLSCGHQYCRACLQRLFEASIVDESLFPPRCCLLPITIKDARSFLPAELVKRYAAREQELKTPDRTYCSSPTCSVFIPPNRIANDRATCKNCGTVTCSICKSEAHRGDCPQDPALQTLLRTAQEQGWKRCYSCHRVIELDIGCNHITCHCHAQFCYKCGRKWKSCSCAVWDADRLAQRNRLRLARANQLANNNDNNNNNNAARLRACARQVAVVPQAQAVPPNPSQNRNCNRNCTHQKWRFLVGLHACGSCQRENLIFAYRCRQCEVQVCPRCRNNRR